MLHMLLRNYKTAALIPALNFSSISQLKVSIIPLAPEYLNPSIFC